MTLRLRFLSLLLIWLLAGSTCFAQAATVLLLPGAAPSQPTVDLLQRLGYPTVVCTDADPAAALHKLRGKVLVLSTGPKAGDALPLLNPDLAGMITLGAEVPDPERHDVAVLRIKADPAELLQVDSPTQKAVRHFLAEHAPQPVEGLPDVEWVASPNWDVRPLNGKIDTVVVHATVIDSLAGTEKAFLDDKVRRVSAHYVIDRDGRTVQMVDERAAAWHAGVSELNGRTGLNAFSVGVELVNLNDGKDPYPEAQVAALARVIRHLREHWTIPDERIVSHAAIARPVGRKTDPAGFDFRHLRELLK